MITMKTNDAPMATQIVIQAEVDSDDSGAAAGGWPRACLPAVPTTAVLPSLEPRRRTSCPTTVAVNVLDVLHQVWQARQRDQGSDDGGGDSGPSRISWTSGRTVRTSETKESGGSRGISDPRTLGLVRHRNLSRASINSSKEAKRSSVAWAIIRSMTWARASGTSWWRSRTFGGGELACRVSCGEVSPGGRAECR